MQYSISYIMRSISLRCPTVVPRPRTCSIIEQPISYDDDHTLVLLWHMLQSSSGLQLIVLRTHTSPSLVSSLSNSEKSRNK